MSDLLLKQLDQDHLSAAVVAKLATKNGFRRIGYGAFSTTYGKKDVPYVVKVNRRSDPAAYKFYSMIEKKSSKYLPKLHKFRTYVDGDGKFLFVAAMERLQSLNKRSWKLANKDGVAFANWLASHPEALIDLVEIDECETIGKRWAKRNARNAKLIESVIDAISSFGCVDFHDANMMLRPATGDIVLTDPVCTI